MDEELLEAARRAIAAGESPDDVAAWLSKAGASPNSPKPTPNIAPGGSVQQAGVASIPGLNIARTAAQGATFGLADEGEGLVRGAMALVPGGKSPAEAYGEGRDSARAGVEQFREDHPLAAFGVEMAGGITSGIGAGRTLAKTALGKATQSLPRLTRFVGGSAAAGGVAGAGASEGGLADRARGAAAGSLFGLGAAGAFGAGGAALRGGRGVGRTLMDFAGVSPTQTPSNPITRALLPTSVDERIRQTTARNVDRTGKTTDELIEYVQANPNRMGADITPRLARAVGTVPSEGSGQVETALRRRQEGQAGRIAGSLERRTGLTRGDAPMLIEDITEQQAAKAKPLYDEAYNYSVPARELEDLLDLPEFREAYKDAQAVGRIRRKNFPDLFSEVDPQGKFTKILDQELPVEALDLMKKDLDAIARGGSNSTNAMSRSRAGALAERIGELRERADDVVRERGGVTEDGRSVYQAARDTWGQGEDVKKAAEFGEKFLSAPPSAIIREFDGMSEAEKLASRRVAVDKIMLRLEGTGDTHDATRKIAGNSLLRQRLRLLFDEDAEMDAFINEVADEAEMGRTFNTFRGGSNTVDKTQDVADLAGIDLTDIARGITDPPGFIGKLAGTKVGALSQGVTERMANAASPFLTAQGDDLTALLKELEEYRRREAAATARRSAATRGAATVGGLRGGG